MKEIRSKNAPEPIGPYSQAIITGGVLYVSGQIALAPSTGDLVSGSIKDETVQVMENLKAILAEAGLSFADVVKCSIYLTSMASFPEVNDVYGSYLTVPYPVRETVAVAALPKGAKVEISLMARIE